METVQLAEGNIEELSTWKRERSIEELRSFVTERLTSLPDDEDVE